MTREISVRTEPLDSIPDITDREVTLLKIDVQDFEGEVLNVASALLSRCRYVILEAAFMPTYEGGVMIDELCHRMVSSGFRLRYAFNTYAASTDLFWEQTWAEFG